MNKLQFVVLASGSKGNAVYVQPGNGPGFLLDCGLSRRVLKRRLKMTGKSLDNVSGALITHTHGDHQDWTTCRSLGWVKNCHRHGIPFWYFGTEITPFELSHGDCPCYGFRVDYKEMSFAYLVDTEYVPEQSLPYLFDLDAIIIEANYREAMVDGGKRQYGDPTARHLSNEQAACILGLINSPRLKHVIMAHGSSRNNTEAFAWNAGKAGAPQAQVLVARQDWSTKMITLMSS